MTYRTPAGIGDQQQRRVPANLSHADGGPIYSGYRHGANLLMKLALRKTNSPTLFGKLFNTP